MSDHISGPRALADPIADITDVYAFPSPERPGQLVLVMNTLPFAPPVRASFRTASSTASACARSPRATDRSDTVRRRRGGVHVRLRLLRSLRRQRCASDRKARCTTPAGEIVQFRVNDEQGGSGHGVRVFAGPRWDPFIMDAPAALKTIATGELAFTDPGSIFLDGKNVLSLVVEVDCAQLLGGVELVGVVAETLTRGRFNVRIERVGRPEVKNMMLAPKQFDPVNRDLEIRDLYNMEDAFHLARRLPGRLPGAAERQPRLLGRARRQDRLARRRERRPPADRARARRLPRRRRQQAVRRARLVPGDRARRPQGQPHETCGGRALNDDVMDTIFTLLVNAGNGPIIRDGVDQATRPASRTFPYLAPPNPDPPEPPEHLYEEVRDAVTAGTSVGLELDDIQSGALHERPSPYVGTYLLLRIDDRAAGRELVRRLLPVVDSGRPASDPAHGAWITVAFTYQGLKALGVPQDSLDSFAPEFRQGMAARAAELGDVGESSPEPTGRSRSAPATSTSRWPRSRPMPRGWRRWSSGRAARTRSCPASR